MGAQSQVKLFVKVLQTKWDELERECFKFKCTKEPEIRIEEKLSVDSEQNVLCTFRFGQKGPFGSNLACCSLGQETDQSSRL